MLVSYSIISLREEKLEKGDLLSTSCNGCAFLLQKLVERKKWEKKLVFIEN